MFPMFQYQYIPMHSEFNRYIGENIIQDGEIPCRFHGCKKIKKTSDPVTIFAVLHGFHFQYNALKMRYPSKAGLKLPMWKAHSSEWEVSGHSVAFEALTVALHLLVLYVFYS